MVIYADILLCVNLFVNYFLLLAVKGILRAQATRIRLLYGAGIGAIASFLIFLPSNTVLTLVIRLLLSAIIIFTSFGFKDILRFIKLLTVFYSLNFAFAGIFFAAATFTDLKSIAVNNGIVYIDISVIFVIFTTLICYIASVIYARLISTPASEQEYELIIETDGKKAILRALVDTGNNLEEVFSGYPVIVAEFNAVSHILPADSRDFFSYLSDTPSEYWAKKTRVIPCATVWGSGILRAFRPERILLKGKRKTICRSDIYVAIAREDISRDNFSAVINPKITEVY